jgi:hypothetical protein
MTDDSLLLVADLHWGGFINQWGEKKTMQWDGLKAYNGVDI